MKFIKKYGIVILIAIILIVAYEVSVNLGLLNSFLFYSITTIPGNLAEFWPKLLEGLKSSLLMLGTGYILSVVAGILIGSLVGLHKNIRTNVSPFITVFSAIPVTLITPYAINLFPSFWAASVFIIFLGCFWIILGTTITAVHTIDRRYLENAATLELKGAERFFRIVLPAASPGILSGCSIALTLAFYMLAVAEMFGATSGLGYFIQYYSDFGRFDIVLSGFVFMAFVLVVIMVLFDALKARILHWTINN